MTESDERALIEHCRDRMLRAHGTLPAGGRIIGIGRDDHSAEQYRALIKSRFDKVDLAKRPAERHADGKLLADALARARLHTLGAGGVQ